MTDNTRMIDEKAAMRLIKKYVEECGSQKVAAKALEISPQFLCDVLQGFKQPYSIMCKLGWQKVVKYKPIGSAQ